MVKNIECGNFGVYRIDIKVINSKEKEPKEKFGSIKVLVDSTDWDIIDLLISFAETWIQCYFAKYKKEDNIEDYIIDRTYQKLGYDELMDAVNLFAIHGMDSHILVLETFDGREIKKLTPEGQVAWEVCK